MGFIEILLLVSGLLWTVVSSDKIQCLNCHHSHDFPECLFNYVECKHNEKCVIVKEQQNVVMVHCGNENDCYHFHFGQTRSCCATLQCLLNQLQNSPSHATTPQISSFVRDVGCPEHCQHHDFYTCITQSAACSFGEFCDFDVSESGVKGKCQSLSDLQKCELDAIHHNHCPAHYTFYTKHHCRFCCMDQTCRIMDFLHPTSPRPPTTTPMPTTTTTTTTTTTPAATTSSTTSNYICQDSKSDCVAKQATICKDEAGVLQCSQTCGLCAVIKKEYNGTDPCEDQLLNGECVTFAVTHNMCSNSLAPFVCPHVCGLCGTVMSSLAQKVLGGTTTAVPTTTLPSNTVAQCVDTLQGMSCSAFPNICSNAFGTVSCRKFCNLCGGPTTP